MTIEEQKKKFRENKTIYDAIGKDTSIENRADVQKKFVNSLNNPATSSTGITSFSESQNVKNADAVRDKNAANVQSLTSKKSLVDQSVYDTMGSEFKAPTEVAKANAYLSAQLKQIQNGKTSYTDQINELMNSISGRDKFSYDVENDTLFQQALASAMQSGRTAMQDTMGQAASLTGGYGSSYATSAANQAYNAMIEDAYANLPQYYQMAFDAYQAEGDELYRQLNMYTAADESEYGRMLNAYNVTNDYRNRAYDEAYTAFRDTKTDAYNTANLRMSEDQQLVNNAMTAYNVAADTADNLYSREFDKWSANTELALNDRNYNRGVYESDRSFDEGVRQYNDSNYWKNYWNQVDNDYRNASLALDEDYRRDSLALDEKYRRDSLAQDESQFNQQQALRLNEYALNTGDKDFNGVLDENELDYIRQLQESATINAGGTEAEPEYVSVIESRVKNLKNNDAIFAEIDKAQEKYDFDDDVKEQLLNKYALQPLTSRQYTLANRSSVEDKNKKANMVFEDEYGNQYSAETLFYDIVEEELGTRSLEKLSPEGEKAVLRAYNFVNKVIQQNGFNKTLDIPEVTTISKKK